ncbi:unnamed protein product [Sphagnum troendelagicum]|uniref:Chromosome transmission fidelity protein 8 n=1 Tax=Sphagnum troendelagicum TaxID=128251 RepID=A0ABP0UBE3_9BRYO
MQIPVKCGCGGCEEWAMVELQGSLDIQHATSLQNLSIGSLCRTSANKYKFVIGYHELEGTKVALKKPIAILKKIKHSDGMEIDPQLAATPVSVEMQVVGIIRHKLLFKTRPKALISKVEAKPKRMPTLLGH